MPSVRQRPDGKWRARYRDDEGKEHSKHFARKRDGQDWLDGIATSRRTGTYVDPARSTTTLRSFYAEWSPRQLWAEGTRRSADGAVGSCSFLDTPFGKLRRSHAETWVKQMQGTLAPSTIRTRTQYVRSALRAAVLDRVLAEDPMLGLRLPAVRKLEHAMRIPTPEEVNAIRDAAEEYLHPLLDLMAYAGLRIGEASAVQLGDIDFLRRSVHVERQIQNRTGVRDIIPPKHESERVVPVPDALTSRVSAHVASLGTFGDEAWLLPGGTPSPDMLRKAFNQACRGAGVSGITPHDYRHHYASGLIRAGLDAVSVARAMGHASPAITLKTYAHLWPDAADRTRAAAAELMATADSADQLRTRRA